MPIEKRPTTVLPKGPRPGSRPQPHRVADNESLETVARKYGVPVKQLIMHNFGTMDPGEINWYLREYVGCKMPTHDQKNWRFSKAANPGLIYIPRAVLQMDPVEILGGVAQALVVLDSGGPAEFLAAEKFVHEFKIPPKEPANLGYLIAQAKISVEGELKQQGGFLKTSLKKGQVKAAIEKKLSDDTAATFTAKFEEKTLKPMAEAIAKGSKQDFFKSLLNPFEATIKTNYRWGKLSIVPEAGVEISTTPLIIRVAGEFEDSMILEGAPFRGKFAVKLALNVGLSAKGWAWIAEKVGKPVLQRFLLQGGRALAHVAAWLVAEGVLATAGVVAVAVVGSIAMTTLVAWAVEDAKHKGELRGLATWYVSAYTAKVFRYNRPTGFITGNVQLRDQLVLMGEKDALLDARAVLDKANHPAARGTDQQALEAFREMLLVEQNGHEDNAKLKLRLALEEKSRRLAGL